MNCWMFGVESVTAEKFRAAPSSGGSHPCQFYLKEPSQPLIMSTRHKFPVPIAEGEESSHLEIYLDNTVILSKTGTQEKELFHHFLLTGSDQCLNDQKEVKQQLQQVLTFHMGGGKYPHPVPSRLPISPKVVGRVTYKDYVTEEQSHEMNEM